MNLARLKDLREDRDLTQRQVGELLYVHVSTYARYEKGLRPISLEQIECLADFYQTSVDYLIGRTNHPEPYGKKRTK